MREDRNKLNLNIQKNNNNTQSRLLITDYKLADKKNSCKVDQSRMPVRSRFVELAHHLECGQIFLPPDVLLVFGSHRGHHVIEVHDDVDERVQHSEKGTVAACPEKKNEQSNGIRRDDNVG